MAAEQSPRKYDIVVFGASGFTGQFVVEEIARTEDEEKGLKWAVAGRNMSKLKNALESAGKITGKDLSNIPIIIADLSSDSSIHDMCKETKLLLNCVGPYQLYGNAVVKACIEKKTHHIDICGEPLFLENTQLVYDAKAKEAGIFIVGACGFDSIPSDMSIVYLKKKFEGDLNHVEGYITINVGQNGSSGNIGTWNSAIISSKNTDDLKAVRKQLFKESLPRGNFRIPKRPVVFYSHDTKGWCLPFVGVDRSVVMRTERYNYEVHKERPVQFNIYMRLPSIFTLAFIMLVGLVFGIFSHFSFGRKLMMMFPKLLSLGLFDSKGPQRKQITASSFTLDLIGHGYKNKLADISQQHELEPTEKVVAKVSGPDIGYLTTSVCMVQAAYTLLKEQQHLPKHGGVFTPGAAFAKTELVERLCKHGIKFEILQQ